MFFSEKDPHLKGCVCCICASLFFKPKRKHLSNQEKCFLFHFKSSFCSRENKILEFCIFKFHDVIKCLSIKQIYFTESFGKQIQSVNEIWPVYVILQKNKFHQKFLQNLRPENQFQALLCLRRMKCNFYWQVKFLKQATSFRYVIGNLSQFVQISMLTFKESFLQRIL